MPCNQHTKRCQYDRLDKTINSPSCCLSNLKRLFQKFHVVAEQCNVVYFLDFGSLLGCYRSGSIISHDTDIDISMFYNDRNKLRKMRYEFEKYKFVLKRQNDEGTFYRLFFSKKNSLHIDIHIRQIDENNIFYCHYSTENWGIHTDDLFPLQKREFENVLTNVPNNGLGYLEHGYGTGCLDDVKRKDEYEKKL